jgi:CheY-like chemotaxis protein
MAMNGKFTVLLVEDEPIIRVGVADFISSQGYAVIEAGSGDRAIDIVKSGTPVDIIRSAKTVLPRPW